MAWTNLTYSFGSLLTSTKMTQNQANFLALAAGDAGAPTIIGSSTISGLFGEWEAKTIGATYIASYDLIVLADSDLNDAEFLRGITDVSATPTTIRIENEGIPGVLTLGVTFPVKKNDYYKVTTDGTSNRMFIMPVGR